MQTPPKKSNQLLLIVGLVIGSMAGTFAGSSCWKPPTIEQLLERTAVELNKGLPKMADQETRLDSASTGPNKTLIYHYTLVNLRAADVQ
ncbi:MAG TPA: hypothetical protein VGO11_12550, partial [Chthoniobacteraceae bacterium]|nr:hypothetical protein [Chthoniobacteraceae bacterium]